MKYLPLSVIKPLEKEMKERGVSEVARSPRGFLTAYRKAGGRKERLSEWWQNRRDNFVDRHMTQVKKRDEALWDDDGRPSRRHLALIAWAYTPHRVRLTRYLKRSKMKRNPFKSQAQRRLFYAKARRGEISPKVVREWERATGERKLPERANPSKKALDKYKETHWGIEADATLRKNDPDLPRELVEMGKLLELVVKPESQEEEYSLQFPDYEKTSLAFSQGKDERLYIILPRKVEQALKRDLWQPDAPTVRLGEVNKLAGGRHTRFRCPGIQVQVLGRVTHVIYQTQKLDDYKEDGQASRYIHEMGEESGILPYLTIASDGTLWFAGGNYRVLKGGITD